MDALLSLLENLARPYDSVAAHPSHVLHSELHVLSILADCCSERWLSLKQDQHQKHDHNNDNGGNDENENKDDDRDEAEDWPNPPPLDDRLISRILDALRGLLEPIPEDYVLPAQTLLDPVARRNVAVPRTRTANGVSTSTDQLNAHLRQLDTYIKIVVEYVTASSWKAAFDYFRNAIYSIRSTMINGPLEPPRSSVEAETAALVVVRLLSFFWVDGLKLRLIIQEVCSSYLHFRKPYQNAIAVVIPLLITRWIDRFPSEFVELHLMRRRLDVSADTLFDMAQRMSDSSRKRSLLFPLQTTLLFLLPDIFEVASNLTEAKSPGIVKKVAFLDGLRKALRSRHEPAAYCLVSLLRAARHFDAENDAALVSYAMDVQDEVREAVFQPLPSPLSGPAAANGPDSHPFDQDTMTAAFVSLARLNLDVGIGALVESCILTGVPGTFKLAAVRGCCYFAQQPDAKRYQELFHLMLPFMSSQLEVSTIVTSPVVPANECVTYLGP